MKTKKIFKPKYIKYTSYPIYVSYIYYKLGIISIKVVFHGRFDMINMHLIQNGDKILIMDIKENGWYTMIEDIEYILFPV